MPMLAHMGGIAPTHSQPRRWKWVDGQHRSPAALPPGKDPVFLVQEAEWALGTARTVTEGFAITGILYPDRPAPSELLYLLHYHGRP